MLRISQGPFATAPALEGTFIVWSDIFSREELDAIEHYGDGLSPQAAGTLAGTYGHDSDARVTRIAWMLRNAEVEPLYTRLERVVLHINEVFFRYDLSAIMAFQYTVYDQAEGSRFGWHQDYGIDPASGGREPRKLTLSLQLSEPSAYQDCELQTQLGDLAHSAPKARGTLVCFPSYVPHRVTPITSGIRKALVIWAAGPEFR
jgi:PKHD-type hydroxylase